MAKAFQEYVDEVRSGLQDPNGKFFLNTEIMRWLNYAIQLFAKETRCLKKSVDYTWVSGEKEVALATVVNDPLVIRPVIENAHWTYGSTGTVPLIVSMQEIWKYDNRRDVSTATGTPTHLYYNPYAKTVGLYPTPGTTGTLSLFFSYELGEYTALTQMVDDVFDAFWIDICAYAIGRGKLKDVDHYSPTEAAIENERFVNAMRKERARIAINEFTHQTINFVRDYPRLNKHGK